MDERMSAIIGMLLPDWESQIGKVVLFSQLGGSAYEALQLFVFSPENYFKMTLLKIFAKLKV